MISFGELLLIGLVSLLVIGPRRLPETVRFIALQAGRLRQTLTDTRKMVEDELGMDDIRRQLHNEQVMRSLNSTREEIERAARGLPPSPKTPATPTTANDTATESTAQVSGDTAADAAPEQITPADDAPSSPESTKS